MKKRLSGVVVALLSAMLAFSGPASALTFVSGELQLRGSLSGLVYATASANIQTSARSATTCLLWNDNDQDFPNAYVLATYADGTQRKAARVGTTPYLGFAGLPSGQRTCATEPLGLTPVVRFQLCVIEAHQTVNGWPQSNTTTCTTAQNIPTYFWGQ